MEVKLIGVIVATLVPIIAVLLSLIESIRRARRT
jgi:hypothetical protein